jgi:hypothetical protein
VEVDFVVGTVTLDSTEESLVRKLALDRLRRSLKKGMLWMWSKLAELTGQTGDAFSKSSRPD